MSIESVSRGRVVRPVQQAEVTAAQRVLAKPGDPISRKFVESLSGVKPRTAFINNDEEDPIIFSKPEKQSLGFIAKAVVAGVLFRDKKGGETRQQGIGRAARNLKNEEEKK